MIQVICICSVDHRDQGLWCEGKKSARKYQTVFINQKLLGMTAKRHSSVLWSQIEDNHTLTNLLIPSNFSVFRAFSLLALWVSLGKRKNLFSEYSAVLASAWLTYLKKPNKMGRALSKVFLTQMAWRAVHRPWVRDYGSFFSAFVQKPRAAVSENCLLQ